MYSLDTRKMTDMKTSSISIVSSEQDYELLDSGLGEKLERYGEIVLSRPDPQALWERRLSEKEWKSAHGKFIRSEAQGSWSLGKEVLDRWDISLGGLRFQIKPTAFKHTGVFPEQAANWAWIKSQILSAPAGTNSVSTLPKADENALRVPRGSEEGDVEVLNLFGYTGGATLAAAQAGAKVVHVDGSKAAIGWARENAELSGLDKKPIRWILDDARAFVRRELKRGRSYDGIIMDPPAFGHGPENELWKIEDDLLPLINDCFSILKPKPLFFLINGYSAGYSAIAYENILLPLVTKYGGSIEIGELVIKESEIKGESGKQSGKLARLLPAGIFARWSGQ